MIRLARILLPTDLSDYASYARPYAVELASAYRASLHLIYVVDTHWVGPVASAEIRGAEFPGQIEENLLLDVPQVTISRQSCFSQFRRNSFWRSPS